VVRHAPVSGRARSERDPAARSAASTAGRNATPNDGGASLQREVRSNLEWRLNSRLSVEGSHDNVNDISSSALGNLGADIRWRLEFE
jgi:hypothetical protein